MNRKVRLFLIVNVALQLGMGLLLLTRGISPVWLIPYVVGILIANIFAYQIFYLQPRRVRDELHRVVEEQSWVDFLKPHEPDHDLRDLIRPLLKAYSRVTWLWAILSLVRAAIQIPLIQAGQLAWLGATPFLFYGLVAITIAASWWVIKRTLPADHPGIRQPQIPATA